MQNVKNMIDNPTDHRANVTVEHTTYYPIVDVYDSQDAVSHHADLERVQ